MKYKTVIHTRSFIPAQQRQATLKGNAEVGCTDKLFFENINNFTFNIRKRE